MSNHGNNLADKIAKALQRRHGRGLTIQQINQNIKKTKKGDVRVEMGHHRKPFEKNQAKRQIRTSASLLQSMFVTASIGDFFALESFFTDEERSSVTTMFYATQKSQEIQSMLKSLPNMPALKNHKELWTDFSHFWCFYSKEDFIHRLNVYGKILPDDFKMAKDFSISCKFGEVMNGNLTYNGSSFIKHTLSDISKFNLPKEYITICPYSSDKRVKERDFDSKDWDNCLEYLKSLNMKGVVINHGNDQLPESDLVVDLSNKTTLPEAVEILKASVGYVGIDSCLSVLAAKLFAHPRLVIKSINSHCYANAKCYFAPQNCFDFLVREVKVPDGLNKPLVRIESKPTSKRTISLNVCQGIGDILWVYQKFYPYVDEIRFFVYQVPHGPNKEQTRASEFLKLLPKVTDVRYKLVSHDQYHDLVSMTPSMSKIMDKFNKYESVHFDYCCNNFLERGIRIEEIDPDYPIEEKINFSCQKHNLPHTEYVVLYVSGGTMVPEMAKFNSLWDTNKWKHFVKGVYEKYELNLPLVIIGASYDHNVMTKLSDDLRSMNIKNSLHIDLKPAIVVDIIKQAKLYIGYQSGLNVIADNYDVKQIMMYFPNLFNMKYSWCKKKNRDGGIFNADTFDKEPIDVLNNLK